MQFLLAAAWTRFYLRPTFYANLWRFQRQWLLDLVHRLDTRVAAHHARREVAKMSRAVSA
jgi:hypothetical protein